MHTKTTLAVLAATASLAVVNGEIWTIPFYPTVISDDPAINGWVVGQYHPTRDTSVVDLWPIDSPVEVMPTDYVFLAGDSSGTLSLVWNRPALAGPSPAARA